MLQYKIFHIFDKQQTVNCLIQKFGKEILIFNDNLVAIPYDYGKRGYKYVLEGVRELPVKQSIITPINFLKMLEFAIINSCHINNITFIDSIPGEEQEFIKDYTQRLNRPIDSKEKYHTLDKLFKELEWLAFDESIDIKSVSISCQGSDSPIKYDLELYNNGVLLADDISILDQVQKLITYIN
ncbi:hypothetical protein ACS49_29360 [Bacillus cereus]|uniref:hypothetical protein n=1 Tax=Bacillus cereus group TaxID=86661 RepID=UPI00077216F3|nr:MULTISPECIES: hypothetical protein [Bacillus cereus group]KXI96101.1 hypothetical protein ACS49_29360 [Bacillus cereus]KYQ00596.1 hypothetical protein B4079_4215 [Bacillus cereus]MDA2662462.1 hypothetical protein [Bacillus cereus group sp. Bc032]MDA2673159.1 hypothetical protein [Bacillus cereus group sp. Bc031]MDA2678587.1 hypothetical protein [Bacillus cereus group sp. Bc029]